MSRWWWTLPILAILGGAGFYLTRAKSSLKPGDPVPAFSLPGTDDQTYSAESLRGQTYVLAWFPRAFTAVCTSQCKTLSGSRRLRQFDVRYFAASCDAPEKNREFAASIAADYPILSDPSGAAATAFGIRAPLGFAARTLFIVGPDGIILDVEDEIASEDQAGQIADKLERLGVTKKSQ